MKLKVWKPWSGKCSSTFFLHPNSSTIPKSCQNKHQAKHPSPFKGGVWTCVTQILMLTSPLFPRMTGSRLQYPSPVPGALIPLAETLTSAGKMRTPEWGGVGGGGHHAPEIHVQDQDQLLYIKSYLPTDNPHSSPSFTDAFQKTVEVNI